MKKKFMGIALVLASALFVGNVSAEMWKYGDNYGIVSDVTDKDAYIGEKKPVSEIKPDTANTTVTFTSGDFVLLGTDDNAAGHRDAGYSWVGVKVAVPEGAETTGYKVKIDNVVVEDEGEGIKTAESFTEFFGISKAQLEENLGGYITYQLGFDWNHDDVYDQSVIVSIDTMGISLYEEGTTEIDESKALWTPAIAKAKLAVKEAEEKEAERIEKEHEIVAAVVSSDEDGVSVVGTLLSKDNDVYKEMADKLNDKGFNTVFGAYELETESEIGENGITLTFNVGTDNNGKAAYILHKKADNTFEEFEGVVKDGVVKITVKELSPFMIALGDVVKDDEPETNDVFPMALVGLITLGLAGTYVVKKAREN